MITQTQIQTYLPFHLNHLNDKLNRKMHDDAVMYDILALSKETLIFYFLKPNETSGGVGFYTEENVPDNIFSSGTLVGTHHVCHDNFEATYSRIFVTMPFAEKEDVATFQAPPRKTKYPVINKAALQKGIHDLSKLGVNKLININKIGNELFEKYNNISLVENVIDVDDKRQRQIDVNIKKRPQEHQHTQLHYNKIKFPPNYIEDATTKAAGNIAVFALHWFDHGGAEKFALASMQKAYDMGFDLYCVLDKRGNKYYEQKAQNICKHIFNIAEGLPYEHWQRFYLNLFVKLNVRLFHIHHAISAYQVLPKIRALTNVKTIVDTTHIIEHTDGGYARISGVFSQYIDYHHTISQELNDYLSSEIHVPHNKIKLGYLFNESNSLVFDDSKFKNIAEKCIVSFIGRLVNQKRPYLFIELVRYLVDHPDLKNKKFEFNMMGEGPLFQVCNELILQYQLEAKINILPADADVHQLLSKSHFLILPSENEGLALVAYEAALNNCIVLSSDVGSQREIVAPDALTKRYPRDFINSSMDIIKKSLKDNTFSIKLLQQQLLQIQAIIRKDNWEEVLEKIYQEAAND